MTEAKSFLEAVWEHREEVLYRRLFGDTGHGIHPLFADLFTRTFGKSCDPRWLHIGVFECPPTAEQPTWAYVSSGLSNPWELDAAPDDSSELSGLGVEYVFNTTAQAEWAIQLVQYVTAYDLLLNNGAIPDRDPIQIGDRIPVQIRDRASRLSLLRRLMVIEPAFVLARHQLASGELLFLQLVGITEQEADLARATDTSTLCERLETRARSTLPILGGLPLSRPLLAWRGGAPKTVRFFSICRG